MSNFFDKVFPYCRSRLRIIVVYWWLLSLCCSMLTVKSPGYRYYDNIAGPNLLPSHSKICASLFATSRYQCCNNFEHLDFRNSFHGFIGYKFGGFPGDRVFGFCVLKLKFREDYRLNNWPVVQKLNISNLISFYVSSY